MPTLEKVTDLGVVDICCMTDCGPFDDDCNPDTCNPDSSDIKKLKGNK